MVPLSAENNAPEKRTSFDFEVGHAVAFCVYNCAALTRTE
jgi:hypothetical protein